MVKIYGSKTCAPCMQLKKYLELKGVAYEDLDASKHVDYIIAKAGRMIMPITDINGAIIIGYNIAAISKELRDNKII